MKDRGPFVAVYKKRNIMDQNGMFMLKCLCKKECWWRSDSDSWTNHFAGIGTHNPSALHEHNKTVTSRAAVSVKHHCPSAFSADTPSSTSPSPPSLHQPISQHPHQLLDSTWAHDPICQLQVSFDTAWGCSIQGQTDTQGELWWVRDILTTRLPDVASKHQSTNQ